MSDMSDLILISDNDYDRQQYIGSSNVAAIIGVGATYDGVQQTPLTVYLAKIGLADEMAPAQRLFLNRRKRWEPVIVEMLREEFKGNIVAINRRYRHVDCDFMCAEIDFEWIDDDGQLQNGEIKTVGSFAFGERFGWGEAGSSDIPVHYAAQTMFGLGIMRRRICIVAVMIGLDDMIFYRIERDDEVIADMRERCDWFWRQHVLPRNPPDPVNLEDCMRLALRMKGRPVEISDELMEALESVQRIRDTRKQLDADEHDLKFQLLDYIRRRWHAADLDAVKDNAILMLRGNKVAQYNIQNTRRIDTERLRADLPDLAKEYTKSSPSRVLRIGKS